MFVYMKLVGKRSQVEFLAVVDKNNYDVHVSLRELKYVSLLVLSCGCNVNELLNSCSRQVR